MILAKQEKDQQADLVSLWQEFHGELTAFLRGRVPAAAGEDLVQSAFLRAHKQIREGTQPENPRAWLYQIVRNLLIDAHRHQRRQRALHQAVATEPSDNTDNTLPENVERSTFAMTARALPLFIASLEKPYREALEFVDLEGLTAAEAASRADVSLAAMKSRVLRGRKQVFAALKRCCEFEIDPRGRPIACNPRNEDDCC